MLSSGQSKNLDHLDYFSTLHQHEASDFPNRSWPDYEHVLQSPVELKKLLPEFSAKFGKAFWGTDETKAVQERP